MTLYRTDPLLSSSMEMLDRGGVRTPEERRLLSAEEQVAESYPHCRIDPKGDGWYAYVDTITDRLVAERRPDGTYILYEYGEDGEIAFVSTLAEDGRLLERKSFQAYIAAATRIEFSRPEVVTVDLGEAMQRSAQRFADEPPTRERLEPVQEVVIDDPVVAPPAAQIVEAADDEITAREVMPPVEADEVGDDVLAAPSAFAEREEPVVFVEVEPAPSVVWSTNVSDEAVVHGAVIMARGFVSGDEASSGGVILERHLASDADVLVEPDLFSGLDGFRRAAFQEVRRVLEPALSPVHSWGDTVVLSRNEDGRTSQFVLGDRHVAHAPRDDRQDISSITVPSATATSIRTRNALFDVSETVRAVREQIVFTVPGTTPFGRIEFGVLAGPAAIPVLRVGEPNERRPLEVVDPSSRQGDPSHHQGSDERHQPGDDRNSDEGDPSVPSG